MAGLNPVGSVGAGLSQAQFQAELQVRAVKREQKVAADLGSAALRLINAAVSTGGEQGYDLDVLA